MSKNDPTLLLTPQHSSPKCWVGSVGSNYLNLSPKKVSFKKSSNWMIIEMILHEFYLTYLPPQWQPGAGWGCQAPDDWPAAVLRFRGSGSVTGSDAPRPEGHGQRFIKFHQVSTATRALKNMGYSETLTKLGQDWIRLDTSDIFFQTKKKTSKWIHSPTALEVAPPPQTGPRWCWRAALSEWQRWAAPATRPSGKPQPGDVPLSNGQ